MPQQDTAGATSTSEAGRGECQRFLALYERESATTRKVLAAYPSAQCELKPHDRSNSAKKLAATFVVEQRMILKALRHEQVLGGSWPKTTDSWEELVAEFDATRDEILALLRKSDEGIFDGAVTFFVGPKQTGEYSTADFVTFMTHDQIHHRGQLSVYLRMAGAKVPSIYGPSADEPWN
jgi:uncharacterized damage-inducible protein DinB